MELKQTKGLWACLKRGLVRNALIFALAMVIYHTVDAFPILFGPVWAPLVRSIGMWLALMNCVDILMRVWQPYADNRQLVDKAETDPIASAIAYAARMFFAAIVLLTFAMSARAQDVPLGENYSRATLQPMTQSTHDRALSLYLTAQNRKDYHELSASAIRPVMVAARPIVVEMPDNAKKNSPLLIEELTAHWPSVHQPSYNAAQIEQETCLRLTHPTCWTSYAQLNVTSKHGVEKGRGFGQLTAVWRANGELRFDNVGTMRLKYPKELGNYGWDNWNDPQLSMRAYVLFMRDTCKSVPSSVKDEAERFKMCLSGYNGGMGGLSNDILSCRATKGCDPTVWDGNVELTSAKSKTRVQGYGQSAFEINRGYVKLVTVERRKRYLILDQKSGVAV